MPVIGPDGRRLGRVVGYDELSIVVGRGRRAFAASLEEIAGVDDRRRVHLTTRTETLLHQYTRGQAAVGMDTLAHPGCEGDSSLRSE